MIEIFRWLHPPALALYMACLFAGTIYGSWMLVGWTALGIAMIGRFLAPDKIELEPIALLGIAVIVVSSLLAVPGSVWWGIGNWELTTSAVIWVVPGVLVFIAADNRLWPWLLLLGVIHAVIVIYGGFTGWEEHEISGVLVKAMPPSGLSHNPNIAAGLLVITLIQVVFHNNKNYRWLAVPLIIAICFTESRWGVIVMGLITVSAVLAGAFSWRWLLAGFFAAIFGFVIMAITTPAAYLSGIQAFPMLTSWDQLLTDLKVRVDIPATPNFLPHGVVEHRGMHNVALRMARETGIISAGAWVVLTGVAFVKYYRSKANLLPRPSQALLVLTAVLLLSILDHYTWRGHLGTYWWLALGILLMKPQDGLNIQPAIVRSPTPGL